MYGCFIPIVDPLGYNFSNSYWLIFSSRWLNRGNDRKQSSESYITNIIDPIPN